MSPNVVFCRRPRNSSVFSPLRYAYTTHDDVTLKIVAAQLWGNPEPFAQPEEATGLQTPTPESNWPWCQDGHGRSYGNRSFMTVSMSTTRRDLSLPSSPAAKSGLARPPRKAGKALVGHRIPTKKFLTFCTLDVP